MWFSGFPTTAAVGDALQERAAVVEGTLSKSERNNREGKKDTDYAHDGRHFRLRSRFFGKRGLNLSAVQSLFQSGHCF